MKFKKLGGGIRVYYGFKNGTLVVLLSGDLKKSIENRKEFFLALLEEDYSWREAINKIVKVIGVNEYAELIGDMKASNLLNQLKEESNITIRTLDKITKPLGIELTFKDSQEHAS